MKRLRIEETGRRRRALRFGRSLLALLGVVTVACRTSEKKVDAEAPPPIPTVAHCAEKSEPALPLVAEGFCLDADSDVRTYGARSRAPLEGVCTELFNGECELYRRFGLNRVESFAYVERTNVGRRISVVRSAFETPFGAFGFFQRRVVGDDHPLRITSTPIDVGTQGALGSGVLYAWHGASVYELVFTSDEDPPEVIERTAKGPLAALARALVAGSGESTQKPRLLERLTSCEGQRRETTTGASQEDQGCSDLPRPVPFGVRVDEGLLLGRVRASRFVDLVLEAPDAGTFRGLVVEQRDARAARDLLSEILRQPLGEKWDGTKTKTLRVTREGAEPEDWTLGVEGRFLVGAGPDPRSSRPLDGARVPRALEGLRARLTRFGE